MEGYQGITWENLWYSGPYTVTSYVHQNEKILTANPNYWNADNIKRFNTVTIKMVESLDVAYNLFQTGELDHVQLTQSTLSTIYGSESHEFHNNLSEARPTKYSYQIHLVYDKNNEDGTKDTNWNTAIANEAFRLSWYYGLDLTPYLARTNAINPLACQNFVYTGNAVAVNSEGVDYTQMVRDELGLQRHLRSRGRRKGRRLQGAGHGRARRQGRDLPRGDRLLHPGQQPDRQGQRRYPGAGVLRLPGR